jgi:hypothetical protein
MMTVSFAIERLSVSLALACPPLPTAPPPWTAALWPLDKWAVVLILLAILASVGLNYLPMRGLPEEQKHAMRPWAIVASATLFIFACSDIFTFFVDEPWTSMTLDWHDNLVNSPGFLECQFAAVDKAFNNSLTAFDWVLSVGFALGFLSEYLLGKALTYRRAYLASHLAPRSHIPPVPDDLAARRAIMRRPYRRGLRRTHWR